MLSETNSTACEVLGIRAGAAELQGGGRGRDHVGMLLAELQSCSAAVKALPEMPVVKLPAAQAKNTEVVRAVQPKKLHNIIMLQFMQGIAVLYAAVAKQTPAQRNCTHTELHSLLASLSYIL